jgi:DNA-binding GntR family transcriptional regulator
MPVPRRQCQLARTLLRDGAYTALREAIVSGELAPGERLNEAELVAWLGVSRTPIREALMRLERTGLVHTKPGKYTVVSPLDARQTRSAQSVAAAMHELAVREAVPVLSQAELDAMRSANGRLVEALGRNEAEAALQADDDFHDVAVTACANPMVRSVLEQVTPLIRRVERLRFSSLAGRGSVKVHDDIIEKCASGNAEDAAAATRANWQTLEGLAELAVGVEPSE